MIKEFQGKYRFLSNFVDAPVQLDGFWYDSVEHAYQAAKTLSEVEREVVRKMDKPGDVKRFGKKLTLRPDWESIKLGIMLDLLRQKFSDPTFKRCLLETGDQELIEGNKWHDTFWGVCNGVGENHLGKLLMQVREELKNGN